MESDNKILNKILIIALIRVGILDYYYSDFGGRGVNGNIIVATNPHAPTSNVIPH